MAKKANKKSLGRPLGTRTPRVGIPARLVAIRTLKGWNQNEAAEAIGISAVTLRRLESGAPGSLTPDMLLKVADAYGSSLDYIYGRNESVLERFAAAAPEVQIAQLSGVLDGLARLAQDREALQFMDALTLLLGNELPDWNAIQAFRDSPAPERLARLHALAHALGRLVRDRNAIGYVAALVLRYALPSGLESPPGYSTERNAAALKHHMGLIERSFGRGESAQIQPLTPSRYAVSDPGPLPVRPTSRTKQRPAARKK